MRIAAGVPGRFIADAVGVDANRCSCCLPRRGFLAGLGAAAIGLAIPSPKAGAQAAEADILDVHAHLTPPEYVQDLAGTNLLQPPTLNWSINKHLDDMAKAGVTTSILSVTTPGVTFGDAARTRLIARHVNDFAAKLVSSHKDKLGMFVAMPLPDPDSALKEIEYGLDVLKADGVGLFTSYDGKWLGDPIYAPVFEELNRRKALVYVHPTSAKCCVNALPYIPDAVIEYGTDTTRAITNMIYTGAARRYSDIRIIWSHAGGTMPFLIERYDLSDRIMPKLKAAAPDGFRAAAGKFFYDTAQTSNPVAMGALRQVIPVSQIVFGTDFPFRTAAEHVKGLETSQTFSPDELRAIYRDNVLRLLPQYKT
jgi:predicted TIM-barrel fold metal-dependent hydrolase